MRYQMVRWLHELESEPVVLYSEIDADRTGIRKVEEYRDGRLDSADRNYQTGSTVLSETTMPTLEQINVQAEFAGHAISEQEFEEVWRRAER